MHDNALHEGAWWACQREQEPQPLQTAFDENCTDCMAIFKRLASTVSADELGVVNLRETATDEIDGEITDAASILRS